jgi:Kef-type K+ transport system membrane component KefB
MMQFIGVLFAVGAFIVGAIVVMLSIKEIYNSIKNLRGKFSNKQNGYIH